MQADLDKIFNNTEKLMSKAIAHLDVELSKIRVGTANPSIVEGIYAQYYGAPTPINQIANISVLDPRTLSVQPWEKNMLSEIDKAIKAANIGITPQNDGVSIRLVLPHLTEERRKELVKKANNEGETCKIAVRNIRRDANEQIKQLEKQGLSEDAKKDAEEAIKALTNKFIAKTESQLAIKEKQMMAI